MMWATCTITSASSLNHPLFDRYHKAIGVPPPPSRSQLADQYLPLVDTLICEDILATTKFLPVVSLSEDGWSSLNLHKHISVCLHFIDDNWVPQVFFPDIIPVESEYCTSSIVENILRCSVERWTSEKCLVATITTDGGSTDKRAAENFVGKGNRLHCAAHVMQIVCNRCVGNQ